MPFICNFYCMQNNMDLISFRKSYIANKLTYFVFNYFFLENQIDSSNFLNVENIIFCNMMVGKLSS